MKYTRPELTPTRSALALVQSQTAQCKCGPFVDRPGLPVGFNVVADPAVYEADE